jgi:hypothetical protein
MRTTLEIDDDVLQAAKEIAVSRGLTAGQVLSELARKGLEPASTDTRARLRNGVPVLPRRPAGAPRPTMRLVNELRDQP